MFVSNSHDPEQILTPRSGSSLLHVEYSSSDMESKIEASTTSYAPSDELTDNSSVSNIDELIIQQDMLSHSPSNGREVPEFNEEIMDEEPIGYNKTQESDGESMGMVQIDDIHADPLEQQSADKEMREAS
ncbi:hypothetical protein H4R24_004697 [Coemansia sp. RSA 988]|nr:hypothetical protein H4R24_004697 [Coemansia sp. RSA 988]